MTRARIGWIAAATVALAVSAGLWATRAQVGPRPSPRRASEGLPRPPRQDEAWTPPRSDLPPPLVEVARLLFEQGLADPRGCAYRDVELAAPTISLGHLQTPTIRAHAWVFPFDATGGPRSAVAWNGLTYPVARLGPAADLEADVRALTRPPAPPAKGDDPPTRPGLFGFSGNPSWGRAAGHGETAGQHDLAPTKVVLLLRLGRADLAELVWKAGTDWPEAARAAARIDVPTVYASLAGDWAWALLDRATTAHALDDDRLALASLRELARIRPMIEARVGPRRPPGLAGPPPPLWYLNPLTQLLADQERRAREPRRTPALEGPFPHRDARIAALIRDLDQVSGAPEYFTGRASPATDPVIQALIKGGDAAVGPLLDCLERDDRLTRTVDRDDRHQGRHRHVQGVDEAAFAALCAILGTRQFGPQSQHYLSIRSDRAKRAAAAAEIRASWEKARGLDPVERYYRTLADDEATPAQWLDAAEALAQPDGVRGRGGPYLIPRRSGGKVPPPRGEPLRARANPSLTELMARRARQLDPPGAPPARDLDVEKANRMASVLAEWDPKGALPTLRDRMGNCAAILHRQDAMAAGFGPLAVDFARFAMLRVRGGDLAALDDYAARIRRCPRPIGDDFLDPEVFEPMWRYPDHPAIDAAARAMFDDPVSSWVPLFGPDHIGWDGAGFLSDLIVSPMLGAAPFRTLILAGLADDRPLGSVRADADGKVTVNIDRRLSQLPRLAPDDPDRPRSGTSTPLRLGDHYARKLQQIEGFPRFEFYWPKERRDQTRAEVIALLSRLGERFRTTEVSQALHEPGAPDTKHSRAILVFPALEEPATAADVSVGRAIFAAPAGTETRRWPMPAVPIEARWTTLEIRPDDPGLRPFANSKGKPWAQIRHLQGGRAWQAEELREGGRWRRYYGFVGRHRIARLPAEEMDFPAPSNTGWYEVSRDLDARLVPPGGRDDGRMIRTEPVPIGAPLPIVLSLRNHRGIAAAIPSDLSRTDGGLSLAEGVRFRVRRQPEPTQPARVAGQACGVLEPAAWPEAAPRREPRRHRSDATRSLEPTATAEALRCDLRDLFDLTEPGHYVVEVELGPIRTEDGSPARVAAFFDLKRATTK